MMTAVNNIIVVNNKPALATHLMRALLLKAGIVFNKVADFENVYESFYLIKNYNKHKKEVV